MSVTHWSQWQPLSGDWTPTPAGLAETLDGGQAFRWHRNENEVWTGIWSDSIAELRIQGNQLKWRAPEQLSERVAVSLRHYLGLDCDWAKCTDSLPWRSDPHLAR